MCDEFWVNRNKLDDKVRQKEHCPKTAMFTRAPTTADVTLLNVCCIPNNKTQAFRKIMFTPDAMTRRFFDSNRRKERPLACIQMWQCPMWAPKTRDKAPFPSLVSRQNRTLAKIWGFANKKRQGADSYVRTHASNAKRTKKPSSQTIV